MRDVQSVVHHLLGFGFWVKAIMVDTLVTRFGTQVTHRYCEECGEVLPPITGHPTRPRGPLFTGWKVYIWCMPDAPTSFSVSHSTDCHQRYPYLWKRLTKKHEISAPTYLRL